MKKNMKKLYSLLFMAVLVLSLTACGSGTEETEKSIDAAYAQGVSEFFVMNFTTMPEEQLQFYAEMEIEDLQPILEASGIPVEAEAFKNAFASYLSSVEELGAYESTGEYELSGGGEETTQVTNLVFADHEATMTLVFDDEGVVTSTAFDITYTMMEILEKAALNTLIGMGTVFIVLIFISFVIGLLPKLTGLVEGKNKKEEAPKAAAPAPAAAPAEEELADDLELVAVISAAIAAYTGTSSDDFVVRSIRRSTANKWKKA